METQLSVLVISQVADPTQFWSAIFMFCSENGRWQATISSSVSEETNCLFGDTNTLHDFAAFIGKCDWLTATIQQDTTGVCACVCAHAHMCVHMCCV